MTLFRLSIRNLRRSLKDYAIYFLTLVLGVAIFYVFNSIDGQTAMLSISENTSEMVELIITVLSGVSVFVSFVLGFLILYASRFLIKKRNKEFGIYMMLGMPKRKITKILLVELLITGIVSLGVGLFIGVLTSQITSVFVAKLFEADMEAFAFNFSLSAVIKTLIYFGIIYLVVMIFNSIMISRNKLIDLLHAEKKNEKIKLKKTWSQVLVFVISIIILGVAYYLVTGGIEMVLMKFDIEILLIPIVMGFVGTFLFFWSVSGMSLKIVSKCKKIYFKNLNTFTFNQLSSKINTAVASVSVICVMIFMTICLLSSAFAVTEYFNNSFEKYAPADIEIKSFRGGNFKEIFENSEIRGRIKDLVIAKVYKDEKFDYGYSLGEINDDLRQSNPRLLYETKVEIVAESDYNNLAEIFHMEKAELARGKYAIVCNYECGYYEKTLLANTELEIFGERLLPNSESVVDGFLEMNGSVSNIGFFVVPDEVVNRQTMENEIVVANYFEQDKKEDAYLNKKIYEMLEALEQDFSIESAIQIRENSNGLSAMATFIGLYLGIIFLIASAAILALKSLSDCIDDREKYNILRKIGAEEKEINGSLLKQVLIFFLLPLSLALVHTVFGVKFCLFILGTLGISSLKTPILVAGGIITLIYGGYCLVTYFCNRNIIKEKK